MSKRLRMSKCLCKRLSNHLSKRYFFCQILFSFFFIIFSSLLYGQEVRPLLVEAKEGQAVMAVAEGQGPSILLTVLRGNPEQGGGEIQEYPLSPGQTVFIRVLQTEDPEKRVDLPLESKVDQVSTQIANKITDIEVKQKEYNDEIYPAFRAPIELEKQAMQSELQNLREQRDKQESLDRAKKAGQRIQSESVPRPKPRMARGLNVQAFVNEEGNMNFEIKPMGLKGNGALETSIQAPIDKWVKLIDKDNNDGYEIWVKGNVIRQQ